MVFKFEVNLSILEGFVIPIEVEDCVYHLENDKVFIIVTQDGDTYHVTYFRKAQTLNETNYEYYTIFKGSRESLNIFIEFMVRFKICYKKEPHTSSYICGFLQALRLRDGLTQISKPKIITRDVEFQNLSFCNYSPSDQNLPLPFSDYLEVFSNLEDWPLRRVNPTMTTLTYFELITDNE